MTPLERMYRWFAIRQRSEKEVRDYFKIKNQKLKIKNKEQISQKDIEETIDNLKKKSFINDEEFARVWTESRRRSKKKGKISIKAELFQKGIGREIIEEVISEQVTNYSEEELAEEAIEKRLKRWENLDPLEFRKKSMDFLMRRGFEYEVARDIVEKLIKK